MNNILLINLRRFGDIFSMSHLINSMIKDNPNAKIEVLVFDEFKRAAANLRHISAIHTIPRKEILMFKGSNLFSDGFAIDLFCETIRPLKIATWDRIVNYSNDPVSSYITSYLTSENTKFDGIKFSDRNSVVHSNDWAIFFNDILPTFKYTPINFIDSYHKITNIPWIKSGEKLVTSSQHNQVAFKNFLQIRKKFSTPDCEVKIIGIQLKSSSKNKDFDFDHLVSMIADFMDDPQFYPVLLVAPNEEEKVFASSLNKYFDNKLITIEADFQAIPSVLMNLDALVTPDTVIKHIADLVETPTLEISMGEAPFLKQGSCVKNNLILTPLLKKRSFITGKNPDEILDNKLIHSSDILQSVNLLLGLTTENNVILSEGVSLYRVCEDSDGIYYQHIAGSIDHQSEISLTASRQFIFELFADKQNNSKLKTICTYPEKEISSWIEKEKLAITKVMRDILTTLRNLNSIQENATARKEFLFSLDRLLSHCDGNHLSSISTILFRTRIESLSGENISKNIKDVESLIFKFKKELQKLMGTIAAIEELAREAKKETLLQKNIKNEHDSL